MDILRLAASTAGLNRLRSPGATVERRSPVCGSRVTVDVVLDGAGAIADFGTEVRACAMGQASTALFAARAIGLGADEIATARSGLAAYLAAAGPVPHAWPELAVFEAARVHTARHAAILLPFDAAAEAVATALTS